MTEFCAAAPGMLPEARITALCDGGSVRSAGPWFDAPRPSPHLARWGIAARSDDGIVVRRGAVEGTAVLVAAQDPAFLGGAVGERHAGVLEALLHEALRTRTPVVLLLASGGVRLHEANPAERALAAALRALLDLRATGVAVIAIGTADVFGGTSVLAMAADVLALVPAARLGLSGPKVIATARGELDPADVAQATAIFGAVARAARGQLECIADEPGVLRAWTAAALSRAPAFAESVAERHAALSPAASAHPPRSRLPTGWEPRLEVVDAAGLFRVKGRPGAFVAALSSAHEVGPRALHALDAALLHHVLPDAAGATLLVVEDSRGQETSVAAEAACVSRYVAEHAAALALLRSAGVRTRALLDGEGRGAIFFANALQADSVWAASGARVIAMDPRAVARVTGVALAAHDGDPLVGHAVAAFARWGGIDRIVERVDGALLDALLQS